MVTHTREKIAVACTCTWKMIALATSSSSADATNTVVSNSSSSKSSEQDTIIRGLPLLPREPEHKSLREEVSALSRTQQPGYEIKGDAALLSLRTQVAPSGPTTTHETVRPRRIPRMISDRKLTPEQQAFMDRLGYRFAKYEDLVPKAELALRVLTNAARENERRLMQ